MGSGGGSCLKKIHAPNRAKQRTGTVIQKIHCFEEVVSLPSTKAISKTHPTHRFARSEYPSKNWAKSSP